MASHVCKAFCTICGRCASCAGHGSCRETGKRLREAINKDDKARKGGKR